LLQSISQRPYGDFTNTNTNFTKEEMLSLTERERRNLIAIMHFLNRVNGKRSHSNIAGMRPIDTIDISKLAQHLLSEARRGAVDGSGEAANIRPVGMFDFENLDYWKGYWNGEKELKTGLPWIDDVMFKRDSTGPLSSYELAALNFLRSSMLQQQKNLDIEGWVSARKGTTWDLAAFTKRVNPFDHWLDEDGYLRNIWIDDTRGRIERRDDLNAEINRQLAANGIILTDEDRFSITVNFDSTITVSGHRDEARGKEIERALNEIEFTASYGATLSGAEFGYYLAGHIWGSMNQYLHRTAAENMKYTANHYLVQFTGYSINQLTVRDDGRLFTDSGKNITDLLAHLDSSQVRSILSSVNHCEIKNARDTSITIDFRNNSLWDINTHLGYGVGQRDWFDKMFSLRGDIGKLDSYIKSTGISSPTPGWVQLNILL
jgi:hypothetical protein